MLYHNVYVILQLHFLDAPQARPPAKDVRSRKMARRKTHSRPVDAPPNPSADHRGARLHLQQSLAQLVYLVAGLRGRFEFQVARLQEHPLFQLTDTLGDLAG